MVKVNPKTRKTNFAIKLPDAAAVHLAGDFNNWNTQLNPMKKSKEGVWKIDMSLKSGEHQFRYFVDNHYWLSDDKAPRVGNAFGSENSIAKVALKTGSKKK